MREALLDTAVDHFGRFGFEGAATRAIAQESGTAMSSITYHFGGKEGLYIAAAEYIAQQMIAALKHDLVAARIADPRSREEAIEALLALLDGFAALMLKERAAKWARFIMREQQEPTEAFERIYGIAIKPMFAAFIRLLEIARPDLDEAVRRASGFLLVGQAMSLRAGRASMCRVLGKQQVDSEIEALMRDRIRTDARCILSAGPETET